MKLPILINGLAAALGAGVARGDCIFNENAAIPEGNPVGVTFAGNVSGLAGNVSGLILDLNVSGGYNGDLYAYLEAPNGTTATLLNNPGVTDSNPFGFGGSGLSIVFSDAATANLQTTPEISGAVVTGSFQPVGSFSPFNGLVANGTWTLFIAADSAGGSQPELTSWGLDIITNAVPEPGQAAALAMLSLGVISAGIARQVAKHRAGKKEVSPG